jgi:hypothetical protein
VADLLECVIQIKGVADTPRRLGLRLASGIRPADGADDGRAARVARRMAEAELCFARCLTLMLADERPPVPALPRFEAIERHAGTSMVEADWQGTFARRRAETVAVLEQCSAKQLGRIGLEPSRGPMTVADLVALMLAHDTDCLGDI